MNMYGKPLSFNAYKRGNETWIKYLALYRNESKNFLVEYVK